MRPNEWSIEQSCTDTSCLYRLRPRAAGRAFLPGVRITLRDRFGFFELHRLLPCEQTLRILPEFKQFGELRPGIKRFNSLPSHGIHRLQRAGVGSELLELRQYAPGDPPKSIAWKVSARRDELMTRQYESEVPVRLHLFIDGSAAARMGGYGKRLLDQMNYVAASVAKRAISVGDPVSGMLIDAEQIRKLPWFSGDRGFLQLLSELADFSQALPPPVTSISPSMLRSAASIIQERYPELLDRRYYRIPFAFSKRKGERFRVATFLAQIFDLSTVEQLRCFEDDALFGRYLQQFLHRTGMPWMAPLAPSMTHASETDPNSALMLSKAIARGVAHARDNEVFVVFSSLSNCALNVQHLLRVTKLALARHHRIAFVCSTSSFRRPSQTATLPEDSADVSQLLFAAEQSYVRELAKQLKRDLTRVGSTVTFSGEHSAIRLILEEVDRARDGRTRLSGARR